MTRKVTGFGAVALFVILMSAVGGSAQGVSALNFPEQFNAGLPLVIGDFMDPYRYDGESVRPLDGDGILQFDPRLDQGYLSVELKTTEESGPIVIADGVALEGTIRLVMSQFYGPQSYMQGGIAKSLLAHGDTGVMTNDMPQVEMDYAGWGWIDIYVNGQLLYEDLVGHFMLNDRVRRRSVTGYTVSRSDGTIYSTDLESKTGFVYTTQKELQLFVADRLAGIQSAIDDHVFLHLNLLVLNDQEEPAGGGGSTTNDPVDETATVNQKGNNGIGNGIDPQPPGNPPVNDGEDGGGGKGNGNGKK